MVIHDVLIIGSGPHALTLASLLSSNDWDSNSDVKHDSLLSTSCSDPPKSQPGTETSSNKLSTKKKRATDVSAGQTMEEHQAKSAPSERVVSPLLNLRVVDTYGEWTALWESQFTALNIPHLRSHSLVHTDPLNKKALQEFALKYERLAELHSLPEQVYILDENAFFNDMRLGKKERKRLNINSGLKKSLSFSLPGAKLTVDFFKEQACGFIKQHYHQNLGTAVSSAISVDTQVERYKLDKVLLKGTVEHITPVMEDEKEMKEENLKEEEEETQGHTFKLTVTKGNGTRRRVKYFQVQLEDGITLRAYQVVMATGPTRAQMANIPLWVKSISESYPEERLQHTVHLMHHLPNSEQKLGETNCQTQKETLLPRVCESGQRVMVVGGGLTSAHVISIALQQGASHVTWVMRKHLQLKQFDVGDVESLVGRYSHVEHGIKMDGQAYLRQFYNERSLHKRLAMIQRARKGGAVTPEAYMHLQPFMVKREVDVKTYCQVSDASWCYRNQAWSLSLSTGEHWTGDMIWIATGCKLDVKHDPLLSEVMKEFPIQVIDGWPCITESLQWTEGCPLYLMGQYTALQVGPHAVNLAGGQAASIRIAKDIRRCQQQNDGQAFELSGHKSKTEEYIQQMRGMLWL